jgi:hypothetical protein
VLIDYAQIIWSLPDIKRLLSGRMLHQRAGILKAYGGVFLIVIINNT